MRPFAAIRGVARIAFAALKAVLSLAVAAVLWLSLKIVGVFDASAELEFNRAYERRVLLGDADMYDLYMADSCIDRQIVSRVRKIFGHQLCLDVARILPDDDFGRIYADLDFVELVYEVEEAFGIDLSDVCPLFGTVRVTSELVQYKILERHGRVVQPPPDDTFAAALESHRAYN